MATEGSTRATNRVLAAIAAVASMGLLPWLDKAMFHDEGASLYSAHLGWTALGRQSRVVDLVVLPYYSFLHLWVALSDSIEWVRFLSLLAFGLTVFLVGHLGNRLGGRRCGVLAAILVATNPLMVEAALNARPYALSALAATAAVTALIRWLEGNGVRWMWWFCLASIATLLLQMFSILAPLSVLVIVFALKPRMFRSQWRELIAPIGLMLASAVSVAALASSQRQQIDWIPPLEGQRLVKAMLGPAAGSEIYAPVVLAIVIAASALCLLAWSRGSLRPRRLELDFFAISLAWAALPTVTIIVASLLVKPVFDPRYVTSSAPGLAIAVSLLTTHAFGVIATRWAVWSRAVIGGAALAIAALIIISAGAVSAATSVQENLSGVAQYLAVHVGSDGQIALPDHSLTAAIDYYLRRDHKPVATWPQLTEQPFIEGFDLRQDHQTLANAPNNVWLVDDGTVAGTSGFIVLLARRGYVRSDIVHFFGVKAVHFRRG